MSEISETEIKSMTKEQNYMRGYDDGKNDVLDKIRAEIEQRPYAIANGSVIQGMKYERTDILEIIDKYKAESEEQDAGSN